MVLWLQKFWAEKFWQSCQDSGDRKEEREARWRELCTGGKESRGDWEDLGEWGEERTMIEGEKEERALLACAWSRRDEIG